MNVFNVFLLYCVKVRKPSFIISNELSFLKLNIHCCEADVKFLENLANPRFESKRCVFCGEGQRFRGNCRKDILFFVTCYFCDTDLEVVNGM